MRKIKKQQTPKTHEKEKADIDIDQIDFNLSLSFDERMQYHQSALDLILELLKARTNETKP